MKLSIGRLCAAFALTVGAASVASAQVIVPLPDVSQTTLMTATVNEQARVTVPGPVNFTVANLSLPTPAPAASMTVDNIVLATLTKQLQISVQAAAANFTAPGGAGTTWAAGDVSWNAPVWTSAVGAIGTLSSGSAGVVATCAAGTASCSTAGLIFTLAAKPTVNVSGAHTLTVRWTFASIGV